MVKTRLIPIVLLRNGVVVQSKRFARYQLVGNPTTIVRRLSDWAADEIIYLDISRDQMYDRWRRDLKSPVRTTVIQILEDVAQTCFMPLTFGGGIRSLEDIRFRIRAGADKVTINTKAIEEPDFVRQAAEEFGSQCIVVSIDARRASDDSWEVFKQGGQVSTNRIPSEWAAEVEQQGAGEILINSIDKDGTGEGYDLELIRSVADAVGIPVIACGGVGKWIHLVEGCISGGASAVAAANIFHYTENSLYEAKRHLFEAGVKVRRPILGFEGPR